LGARSSSVRLNSKRLLDSQRAPEYGRLFLFGKEEDGRDKSAAADAPKISWQVQSGRYLVEGHSRCEHYFADPARASDLDLHKLRFKPKFKCIGKDD